MDAGNPYAPPAAALPDGPADEAELDPPPWRLDGHTLIARNGGTLPDICLFSGEPTSSVQRAKLPLSWTPVWFKIMAVFAPFLAVFAYSALRRTSTVEIGLGRAGRNRRRLTAWLSLGAAVAAIAFLFVATDAHRADLVMVLLFVSFLGLFLTAMLTRAFRVVRIGRRTTRLALRRPVVEAFTRLPAPPR
jgi:hypothetical protein